MTLTLAPVVTAIAHMFSLPFLVIPAVLGGILWSKTRK